LRYQVSLCFHFILTMFDRVHRYICVAASVLAFLLLSHLVEGGEEEEEEVRWLTALDALGAGVFGVVGAANGFAAAVPPLAAISCGVITATFGGAIRDVLCQGPVRVLHSNPGLNAVSAACGATVYSLAWHSGLPLTACTLVGVCTGTTLRATALHWEVRLPVHTSARARRAAAAAAQGDGRTPRLHQSDGGDTLRSPTAALQL